MCRLLLLLSILFTSTAFAEPMVTAADPVTTEPLAAWQRDALLAQLEQAQGRLEVARHVGERRESRLAEIAVLRHRLGLEPMEGNLLAAQGRAAQGPLPAELQQAVKVRMGHVEQALKVEGRLLEDLALDSATYRLRYETYRELEARANRLRALLGKPAEPPANLKEPRAADAWRRQLEQELNKARTELELFNKQNEYAEKYDTPRVHDARTSATLTTIQALEAELKKLEPEKQ